MKKKTDEDLDELRPEYDLRKLKFGVESTPKDIDPVPTSSCWNRTSGKPFRMTSR